MTLGRYERRALVRAEIKVVCQAARDQADVHRYLNIAAELMRLSRECQDIALAVVDEERGRWS